jgi:hypothetical protein
VDGHSIDLTTTVGNVTASLMMLNDAFVKYGGDLSKTAVAYNAGDGALGRNSLPLETMKYLNQANLPEPAHGDSAGGGVPTVTGQHTAIDATAVAAAAAAAAANPAVVAAAVNGVDKTGAPGSPGAPDASGTSGFGEKSAADAAVAAWTQANLLTAQVSANLNAQDAATARVAAAQAALNAVTSGDDASLMKANTTLGQQQQILADLKVKALDLVTAQEKSAKAASDALVPLQAQAGAARVLAQVQQQIALAGEHDPAGVDQTAAAIQMAAAQTQLTTKFNDQLSVLTQNTAAQERLLAVTAQGGMAAELAANAEKALTMVKETAVVGSAEYTRQVMAETAALNAQTNLKREAQAASQIPALTAETQLIQLETATLGEATQARNDEILVMQTRQRLGLLIGQQAGPEQATVIAMTVAIANQKAALAQEQASVAEVAGAFSTAMGTIGSSIAQSLIPAKGQVVDWGNTMTTVAQQVLEAFLKMAVIQPLMNSLFGQSGGTMGGLFSFLSGSGGAAGAASTAGTGMALVGEAHSGWFVGQEPSPGRRAVNDNVFAGAPRLHTGLTSDEFATILQRGEQVLTEQQSASTARVVTGLATGARPPPPPPIVLHVHGVTDPDTFKRSAPQVMGAALAAQQRAVARNGS